jgi:hypothetical protein
MKRAILCALAAFAALATACAVPPDPEPAQDEAMQDVTVPAGCVAETHCSGVKTCGAWSDFAQCSATFHACREGCGFITRAGCNVEAAITPRNRTRSCVIRATGQTCVETDYSEAISCPFNP